MALAAPFPPWLAVTPETYTGAMGAGARLGLQARAEDIRQQTAADRLQLAYEQLAAKEDMAAQALQGKLELAGAQLDLKDKTLEMTAALRERGLDQQLANIESLRADREGRLALAEQKAGGAGGGKPLIHWGKDGQPYIFDAETGTMKKLPGVAPTPEAEPKVTLDLMPGEGGPGRVTMTETQAKRRRGIAEANALMQKAQGMLPGSFRMFLENQLYPEKEADKKLRPEAGVTPSQLTPSAKGAIITDKKGKKWRYTGNMADPKKDRDESHWEEVE